LKNLKKRARMKKLKIKIGHFPKRPLDEPLVSFAHLAVLADKGMDSEAEAVYGFPSSRETELYETGYLAKIFLRC
jgi:hypothetical protein